MKPMPLKRPSGFSLLELMITLSVAGILTVIAYPGMRNFLYRNRVIAQSNNIQADLQLARGQAAATRSYVSICPVTTAGGTTCSASATAYDQGWLVYTAIAPNTAYDSAVSGSLQHVAPATSNISIRASNGGVLTYNARGELIVTGSSATSTTFITCSNPTGASVGSNTTDVPGVQLSVANSGRIASSILATGDSCGT
jgi:type IV fimbrial biogenesis protein FimT